MSSLLEQAGAPPAVIEPQPADAQPAEPLHAAGAWNNLVRALSRDLPAGLTRSRAARRRMLRLR